MFSFFLQFPGGENIGNPSGFTGPETLGGIVSKLLPIIYVIAGLILFVALIWSGLNMIMSSGNPEKLKGAQGCLVNAFLGFILIIASYWIIQIFQEILQIDILR